jgi:hypothetical protein
LWSNPSHNSDLQKPIPRTLDVNIGSWEKGQEDRKFVRETNYIKYLGGSIGKKKINKKKDRYILSAVCDT